MHRFKKTIFYLCSVCFYQLTVNFMRKSMRKQLNSLSKVYEIDKLFAFKCHAIANLPKYDLWSFRITNEQWKKNRKQKCELNSWVQLANWRKRNGWNSLQKLIEMLKFRVENKLRKVWMIKHWNDSGKTQRNIQIFGTWSVWIEWNAEAQEKRNRDRVIEVKKERQRNIHTSD